ncbi:NADPH-dependent FMN reductase [Paenibacillus arenilitoris]|uniref:NAD(P)H-dependent oxidoreductase n=1 Tax=Paenibacillus arenilitoris TaxID=2772299 RepID=A0A927H4A5_9BACL|nr:NAD(P)H-dependent oxidoreductase [Paenibacillus arenilitoris]MBD2868186.1 NAD(P)H-dependent oxidoreductase [Paenibacillus arenilitoris]
MNIVIIAGSNRKAATSTRLSSYVGQLISQKGHSVKLFDLYETPLPFYSSEGTGHDHESVVRLQQAMREADGVVLASPEYHGSISGVLKNALDFLGQDHFRGKAVLSMSSAGGAVGTSSLTQLQAIVRNLHGINSPEWISIGGAQRSWLMDGLNGYEGAGQDLSDRIHRATVTFLDLAALVRNKN